MKTLGVLGGMGPAATLDFLAKLQAATPAARDQDHLRVLVDINPQVPDRNTGEGDPGPVLADMTRGLVTGGAEVLAIACNTAHAFADAVRRAAPDAEFVDMIQVACEAARDDGERRVGVLGTPLSLKLYGERLTAMGLEPVFLDEDSQTDFMGLLYAIKGGDLSDQVRDGMAAAVDLLEADTVIAGCTEVPLVLDALDSEKHVIDAGERLAARCVEVCRS